MSMPTDTKKMAANMSRTGWTRCSTSLLLAGLGDQRAGEEGAERDRVAERLREQRDREAEPTLATSVVSGRSSRTTARIGPRHDQQPHDDQPDEERRPGGRAVERQVARRQAAARGDAR